MNKKIVKGKRVYLRYLTMNDVNQNYLSWLNDKEVALFLEKRKENTNMKGLKKYVRKIISDKSNHFLGIFTIIDDKHIGNIKIGTVHPLYKYAHVGILIGEKKLWGRGYATEAIQLVSEYAFKTLRLHKLYAGINFSNIGSLKAFQKANYYISGKLKDHAVYKNQYIDAYIVERITDYETK